MDVSTLTSAADGDDPERSARNSALAGGIGETAPEDRRLARADFEAEALPLLDAVYRFSLRLAQGEAADAEDLTQETFLRAYRAWNTYRPGTSCRSWLFTICRNVFLRRRERSAARPETPESRLEIDLPSVAATDVFGNTGGGNPERDFFDSFVDAEVLRAVDRLPDDFREVVVLSDLQELSYAEIAETLQIPLGTVRSRLYRGRRLLQEALHEYAREAGLRPRGR
jgi:RNA polymerase sigma-70 factor (ECF subfamily)